MFGIGMPEFILILLVGLIVFGPSQLPEIGRAVGKGLREFKKASNALTASLNEPETPPAARPAPHPQALPQWDAKEMPTQERVQTQLDKEGDKES